MQVSAPLPPPFSRLQVRPDGPAPLHRQIESAVRELVEAGEVKPGDVVPGELELARHLGVSRHTMRHALGALVADGLLRRQRGIGTTVAEPRDRVLIERSLEHFYAFAWEVRARGGEHHSYVLARDTVSADAALALHLGLAENAPVERIERLRTADGEPLILERLFLPASLAVGLTRETLERAGIYDAIERLHGLPVTHAHETIRPIVLERRVARLLEVSEGSPAFRVERQTWSGERPIEWHQSLVRGDRFLYSVRLPRRQVDSLP